jgi:hypothetical protein
VLVQSTAERISLPALCEGTEKVIVQKEKSSSGTNCVCMIQRMKKNEGAWRSDVIRGLPFDRVCTPGF